MITTLAVSACTADQGTAAGGSGAGMPSLGGSAAVGQGGAAVEQGGAGGESQGGAGGSIDPTDGGENHDGMAGNTGSDVCVDDNALLPTDTVPRTLAETGLFAGYDAVDASGTVDGGPPQLMPGIAPLTLAANVRHFVPKYPLWSDGADKDRYIYIPSCSTIDTSDMDHWEFPVGTRLWKTFTVASAGVAQGVRVETRLIHRYGTGRSDWLYAAYQWDETAPDDPASATPVPAGVINANGTTHDIPSEEACVDCHGKLPERVLGFSAFQLSHDGIGNDLDIERTSNLGWLTVPAPEGFAVPGTPVQQAALGYLHGNCGGCHSDRGEQIPAASPMLLRLSVDQTDYAQTDVVATTVGIPTFNEEGVTSGTLRIAPMDPESSSMLIRMQARGTELQMPPLDTTSTKLPDTQGGVADVTAWVNSLQ